MFFTVLGWIFCLVISLIWTIGGPILIAGLSQFGGGSGKAGWIPFLLGCVCLYIVFTHIPFHITFS